MKILVIDGMGGGMGKAIIEQIKGEDIACEIGAAGTNVAATAAMLKAGASFGATGENAVIYNCKKADFIIGAMGIIFANSMHGEISPAMASAVSSSEAYKLLIPFAKCSGTVVGIAERPLKYYLNEMVERLKAERL